MRTHQSGQPPQQANALGGFLTPGKIPNLSSLAALVHVDPFSLPPEQQVQLVIEWERHSAWIESMKADALAALAGPGVQYLGSPHETRVGVPDPNDLQELFEVEDSVCQEVAAAMKVSTMTARRRVEIARDLSYKLPITRLSLRDGVCSYAHAAVVSDECAQLEPAEAQEVEARGLGRIDRQTPGQLRRAIHRVVVSIHPPDPVEVIEAEFARRQVTLVPDGSVMATITATLPAPDALDVWNALTSCAIRDEKDNDPRTMAHKRADALTAWARHALNDPHLPTMQGKKRLDTQLVISWETLIGLNDDSADLVGYGPIPATYARKLAVESPTWRRLVTDPITGHLLDYATRTYKPPTALREYVIARDRTCQFPGCQTQGWRCDLDHVEPWTGEPDGGQTSADNLITLCRRHHRLKTHHNWRVRIRQPLDDESAAPPEVVVEWTSPRGQVHERARLKIPENASRRTELESQFAMTLAA